MTVLPLDRDTIVRRMNGIQQELRELGQLSKLPLDEFQNGVGFKLAQFHLHRALEGIFHIIGHILSRIPGAQATEYKDMARKLGEVGIIEKEFANGALVNMAGYRNRLVHFYAEITPVELYDIVCNKQKDIETFLAAIKRVLENPNQFGLV